MTVFQRTDKIGWKGALAFGVAVMLLLHPGYAWSAEGTPAKKTTASSAKKPSIEAPKKTTAKEKPSATSKSKSSKKSAKSTKKTKSKSAKRSSSHGTLSPARSRAEAKRRYAALVVDAENGQILYEESAHETRHPASLTKMMTLYLLFDALKKRKLNTDSLLYVSAKAAGQPQTNISLTPGDRISVKTAIQSLVVRSANDSAMVVAEAIGGSQEGFARLMNEKARQLGMTDTHFTNPSGLPDGKQVTNAYDMARLGIALRRDFPEFFPYFNLQEFSFRGRNYEGHNRLLGRFPGADGIKTGYIGASGFNLVTSCKRGEKRLVGVIMGGRSAAARDRQMMDMLDNIFSSLARGGRQVSGQNALKAPLGGSS